MTPGRCLGIAAFGFVLALAGAPTEAQTPDTPVIDGPPPPQAPDVISRDPAGRATVRAVRVVDALTIDGTLDETAYETVAPFGGFIQTEPTAGAPATERTEAWVFFDDTNVYISAPSLECGARVRVGGQRDAPR